MPIRTITIGPKDSGSGGDGKATFGLGIGAPQTIGQALTAYYEVRKAGTLFEIVANSKAPGTGSISLDIYRTRDSGATWVDVLGAQKIVLTAGDTVPRVTLNAFADAALEVGDLLRIDLLAGSAEDWQFIEVVARWA
jgi:hypothetical protein